LMFLDHCLVVVFSNLSFGNDTNHDFYHIG
jgi:hypothetical protein